MGPEIELYNPSAKSCFMVSIPRSGSVLTLKVLRLLGLREFFPGSCPTRVNVGIGNIGCTPSLGCCVWANHFESSEKNVEAFRRTGIQTIFVSRDLRDVVVSLAFFVFKKFADNDVEGLHSFPEYGFKGNFDEFLFHLIPHVKSLYLNRVGWKDQPFVYHLTYERLWSDTSAELARLADLLNITLTEGDLKFCLDNFMPDKGWQGDEEIKKYTYYRQGKVGDWKNHFKEHHINLAKVVLGDILIQEGYENDYSW
jgi:hypothetical protein